MTWLLLAPLWVSLFFLSNLMACEEDPRHEEHNKLTDRLLVLGDEQYQVKRLEAYLRHKEEAEKLLAAEDSSEEPIAN